MRERDGGGGGGGDDCLRGDELLGGSDRVYGRGGGDGDGRVAFEHSLGFGGRIGQIVNGVGVVVLEVLVVARRRAVRVARLDVLRHSYHQQQ